MECFQEWTTTLLQKSEKPTKLIIIFYDMMMISKRILSMCRRRPCRSFHACVTASFQQSPYYASSPSATMMVDASKFNSSWGFLAGEDFARHGYKLANVNPIKINGFLADVPSIIESLPERMRPMVQLIDESRRTNGRFPDPQLARAVADTLYPDECIDFEDLKFLIGRYCNTGIGWEFHHCLTEAERNFFETMLSHNVGGHPTMDSSLWAYEQLLAAEGFAKLMSGRYSTTKRFGIEGLEAAVPVLNTIISAFGDYNSGNSSSPSTGQASKRVVLGTQHRGRLDFLAHVLKFPLKNLLTRWDITGGPTYDDICSGYHSDIQTREGNPVHISLVPTPAHLESMNAVVAGKARAHSMARRKRFHLEQWREATEQVLPVTVHGDASVCGQGVVSEALHIGTFQQYDCGGIIRLVLNNQIGFTTETSSIRDRTKHGLAQVTDIGKSVGAPILHVNACNVQDAIDAATIAVAYRQRFGKDIFINLWGWRTHGHNELDDPHPTNVELYQQVDQKSTPLSTTFRDEAVLVHKTLVDVNNNKEPNKNSIVSQFNDTKLKIEEEFSKAKLIPRTASLNDSSPVGTVLGSTLLGTTKPSLRPKRFIQQTSVDWDLFHKAASRLVTVPDGFQLHKQVERVVESRKQMLLNDKNGKIDWATAELLALTTLGIQGIHCRLSGEDVERGTFAQRHAVWHNVAPMTTGTEGMMNYQSHHHHHHHPLGSGVEICNSPLSELGVLGFEYGYSVARPADSLVIWEAQFGDFVNGAQTLLDTVLSSSEEKWGMQSGLTILLPHGYDGMGPEHSSSRLERWLQLFSSSEDKDDEDDDDDEDCTTSDTSQRRYEMANMIVTYVTSPSNYFHLLRRQLTFGFRRPLVVLTPKRTLRLASAASDIHDFIDNGTSTSTSTGTKFQPVLDDPRFQSSPIKKSDGDDVDRRRSKVRTILLCSGEIYYDLVGLHHVGDDDKVAILRLEELAPFPALELKELVVNQYPNIKKIAWIQEEPWNQGGRNFVQEEWERLIRHRDHHPVILDDEEESSSFSSSSSSSSTCPHCLSLPMMCISRPVASAPAVGHPYFHRISQDKLLSDVMEWCLSSSN